jgi:hypothetical protein
VHTTAPAERTTDRTDRWRSRRIWKARSSCSVGSRLNGAALHFCCFAGADSAQQLFILDSQCSAVTLGRGTGCDVVLELDPEASRLHAELQRLGHHWVIADDGLSLNGTFVNGERIVGRHRLGNGDVVRCGNTLLRFVDPSTPGYQSTRPANGDGEATVTRASAVC